MRWLLGRPGRRLGSSGCFAADPFLSACSLSPRQGRMAYYLCDALVAATVAAGLAWGAFVEAVTEGLLEAETWPLGERVEDLTDLADGVDAEGVGEGLGFCAGGGVIGRLWAGVTAVLSAGSDMAASDRIDSLRADGSAGTSASAEATTEARRGLGALPEVAGDDGVATGAAAAAAAADSLRALREASDMVEGTVASPGAMMDPLRARTADVGVGALSLSGAAERLGVAGSAVLASWSVAASAGVSAEVATLLGVGLVSVIRGEEAIVAVSFGSDGFIAPGSSCAGDTGLSGLSAGRDR